MRARRISGCVSLVLCISLSLVAQTSRFSPVITAAGGEKLRFSSPGDFAQIRVQVVSAAGVPLFDSLWKDGNVLDWEFEAGLADGAYRCTIMVKDLSGQIAQKESGLTVSGRQVTVDPETENRDPQVALLVHDGKEGALVNTGGDLSFRLGKFFAGNDAEQMRLTTDGNLVVNGSVRATNGIIFSDGTVLKSSGGDLIIERPATHASGRIVEVLSPHSQATAIPRRRTPAPTVSPDFQFKVDAAGVHIGTTSAFGLDVAGDVTLASNLAMPLTGASGASGVITLAGNRYVHSFNGGTNIFVGTNAGNFTMTGTNNTAIGQSALMSVVDGTGNTATGINALTTNAGGSDNVATGSLALRFNSSGSSNTAAGSGALESNNVGNSNTAVGADALDGNTTGSGNIGIGALAGFSNVTGSNNIAIGTQGAGSETGAIRIGTGGTHTKAFIAGIRNVTTGQQDAINVMIDSQGQLGTVSSSRRFKFDIQDMGEATDRLMQLRPVTFRYLKYGDDAALQYGLIAEEVAQIYPDMVTVDKDGQADTVMYQFLAPMLLNEVQKQRREIEEQRQTIESLSRRLERLEAAQK
jgi:endosialidase-like protein